MNTKTIKILEITILIIGFIMIAMGLASSSLKKESETKESRTKTYLSNNKMVISMEKRYSNDKLVERIIYNYNSKGKIKKVKLKYNCKDYDNCTYMEPAARGLYNYKYKYKDDKLQNLIKIDLYSKNGVSLYYDDDLKLIKKYGYDAILINKEEKDIIVNYEYDNKKRISKRVAIENNEESSTVTFKYDKNNNIMNQDFYIKGGTEYHNRYTYDEHNNVIRFNVKYIIKEEDGILYDSDSYEGMGSKGDLTITYSYEYDEDIIKKINVHVNFNDTYQEDYIVSREYDENKNLVLEKIIETDSEMPGESYTYLRKLYYEESNWDKNTTDYNIKMNQLETQSDSPVDYLYKEDNWISCYHFYMY